MTTQTAQAPQFELPQTAKDLIQQVDANSAASLELVAELKAITDDAQYETAVDVLKDVKKMMNELEAARTATTKPINAGLRNINALFAEPAARLELLERRLKSLTAAYVKLKFDEQQRLLREAAKAAMQQAAVAAPLNATPAQVEEMKVEAALKVAATMAQAGSSAAPAVAGVSHTERWDWAVSDLSLVPREFLMIDHAKVTGAVKTGTRSIPGVNIFPVTQTRVTAGK